MPSRPAQVDLVPPLGLPGPPDSWTSFLRGVTAGPQQARLPLPDGVSATVVAIPLGEGTVLALAGEGADGAVAAVAEVAEGFWSLALALSKEREAAHRHAVG